MVQHCCVRYPLPAMLAWELSPQASDQPTGDRARDDLQLHR